MNMKKYTEISAKKDYGERIDRIVDLLFDIHIGDKALWAKFVDEFRLRQDGKNNGWRGEYWGKSMRGACLVYEYSRDEKLYEVLSETVRDMITVADGDGRVSTYSRETEFWGWDLWSRKYVMLGLEYYLDICRDESLKGEIIEFIRGCADYIVKCIGEGEGQKRIVETSNYWLGLNSSSILEPFVKLYKLTGEKKYLDFSEYIIKEGGAKGVNIFELAYENKLKPCQYGVAKAYEMMSCFEGLYEYYLITGVEKYKVTLERFARAVIESEVTIIGCCGVTHELFDYSKYRQTARYEGVSQETCVSVTWMKFCARMLELTGDSRYADAIETTYYNAYLGALNENRCLSNTTEGSHLRKYIEKYGNDFKITLLPFDSYSPLLSDKRGQKTGGFQVLADKSYYGCCACIGAAGLGVFLKSGIAADSDGIVINQYIDGKTELMLDGENVSIDVETAYPRDGKINIVIDSEKSFSVKLRIPAFAKGEYKLCGEAKRTDSGYISVEKTDKRLSLTLEFDMKLTAHRPFMWDTLYTYVNQRGYREMARVELAHSAEEEKFIAFTRGPLVLGVDSRMGIPAETVFDFELNEGDILDCELSDKKFDGIEATVLLEVKDKKGCAVTLGDYASLGKDWKSDIAAWLATEKA
ncbi:MAG: hypothetical protein E7641_08695 [Ruminococcaceae bacterium]|nr:hypothetical protein [Oscillospiraceae bacterium]